MKINVEYSTNDNAEECGNTIAKKAVLDLFQTKLAVIFSSEKYNTNSLLKGAKSILGTAPIIGCTSKKGIITRDGFITSKKGFAGIMAIGDEETAIGTAISDKIISARNTGRKIAKMARDKINPNCSPAYFMIITTPGEEEEYLKGVQDEIGDVPCFGCVSADENNNGRWKIYTEDGISENGACVAFFYTNKEIKNITDGKFHETIHSGIITNAKGNFEIDEINGLQALKQYAEWINMKTKELKSEKIIKPSSLKPLGVKSYDGEFYAIKEPLNGNTDYSINVSNKISTNMGIVQMQISKEEISESPSLIIRDLKRKISNKPVSYLILHSANRFDEINSEKDSNLLNNFIEKINKETDDLPFIVAFTNGEIGRNNHSANFCENLSISATCFATKNN